MGNTENMANEAIKMDPSPAVFDDEKLKKLKQFCSGRVPVIIHPSLHTAVKLTFPRDIEVPIKTEMSQGSMGQVVGALTPGMFVPEVQHQ